MKLYTIDCPMCLVLEKKLIDKKLEFERVDDRDVLSKLDLMFFPVLEMDDGHRLPYRDAVAWVNNYTGEE